MWELTSGYWLVAVFYNNYLTCIFCKHVFLDNWVNAISIGTPYKLSFSLLQFLVVKVGRVNLGSLLRSELFQHLKIAILFNLYMAPVLHPIRVFHKHVAHFKKSMQHSWTSSFLRKSYTWNILNNCNRPTSLLTVKSKG